MILFQRNLILKKRRQIVSNEDRRLSKDFFFCYNEEDFLKMFVHEKSIDVSPVKDEAMRLM